MGACYSFISTEAKKYLLALLIQGSDVLKGRDRVHSLLGWGGCSELFVWPGIHVAFVPCCVDIVYQG